MSRPAAEGETLYVLFDAHCALCVGTVRRMQDMRGLRAKMQYIALQEYEGDDPPSVPGMDKLSMEELYAKMHVIDESGRAYAGSDGIVRIVRTMPGLRHAAWLYGIPGMRRAADAIYRYVAKRRYDWFGKANDHCENGICRLPDRKPMQDGRNDTL